jgi:hypothetical protein
MFVEVFNEWLSLTKRRGERVSMEGTMENQSTKVPLPKIPVVDQDMLVPRGRLIFIASIVGISAGSTLFLYDARSTDESTLFITTPRFLVWLFFIVLQSILWSIATPVAWKSLRYIPINVQERIRSVIEGIVAVIVAFLVLYLLPLLVSFAPATTSPLAHHEAKFLALTIIGLGCAIPILGGMRSIHAAAIRLGTAQEYTSQQLGTFLQLRTQLQWYISVLGAMIGLATLSIGAARNAILDAIPSANFPPEVVLIYGGYFSIFLVLVYITTYTQLINTGKHVRDVFFPLVTPSQPEWKEWHEGRKNFEEFLQLRLGTTESLQTSVTILAPLISGIISILLST